MKKLIAAAEKDRENRRSLAIKNINKIAMVEIAKMLNVIDLNSRYMWVMNNVDIYTAIDLRLTNIKKYKRSAGKG